MKNKDTSRAVDVLLMGIMFGTVTATMLAAPNAIQLIEKPMNKFFDKMDEREKRRQLTRLKSYLKTRGLVRGDYDHGIELTKKAMKRIKNIQYRNLEIGNCSNWDGKWRLVMFDIPEENRHGRVGFTRKIQSLGYQLLQQSVWVYPYESKEEIYLSARHNEVEEWVSYIVTDHIDKEDRLKSRFKSII